MDVLEILGTAAVAVQVIVLGASVFLPTDLPASPRSPFSLPTGPLGTPILSPFRGDKAALPAAPKRRLDQNLLHILWPADVTDRKVCCSRTLSQWHDWS